MGRRDLQNLVDSTVRQVVDAELEARLGPRLSAIENRISAIETMLDLYQRLSKMEAEVSALKAARG